MKTTESDINELAKIVLTQCQMKDYTLAVAESATGGYLCHNLTNVQGSSKVFIGGIVAYSSNVKNYALKVDFDTINECGIISPETTDALLEGIKKLMGSDVCIAITGVAGSKILEGKPRGMMYVGVMIGNICKKVKKFQFEGTREQIKHDTVKATFEFLLELLENI